MYGDAFCRVYNEFGWKYFPETLGEQLLSWIEQSQAQIRTSLDLGCGTGILCGILCRHGIEACGMDFSEGMIQVAKTDYPDIPFEVADMVTYRPEEQFDLVTCTGDALNHILDLNDVEKLFQNVHSYLNDGGYFIFDILNKREFVSEEPFDLDFSEEIKAQFMVTQETGGALNLKTTVFENGMFQFEETITEVVHDHEEICELLRRSGFQIVRCAHKLLEEGKADGTIWFIIAKK